MNRYKDEKTIIAVYEGVLAIIKDCECKQCIDDEIREFQSKTDLSDEQILQILREIFLAN